jgi:hypothetical protein
MAYTLNVNNREEQKRIVMALMGWERDIFDHTQTLERFRKMLEDETFVGSTMTDNKGNSVTFRQKIENEIPVLEGRIAECEALIKAQEDLGLIPDQETIDELIAEINAA